MIATIHRPHTPAASLITAERYRAAPTFAEYLASAVKNKEWWESTYRLATVDEAQIARAGALRRPSLLLALSEDWCGDVVNILPHVARLAEAVPATLQLRILGRDANPDVMNAHLTGQSRSIPIVIALDSDYVEYGWWGPRPLSLQERAMGEWRTLAKDERRLLMRTWYARDRGRQIVDELLQLLETVTPTK
ncbi:MAG: thioredoxin family protein [Gemmatimonadaceae bacterium]